MTRRNANGPNAAAWFAGESFHHLPAPTPAEAQHKIDSFETALELRRQVNGAIVQGGTVSSTTIGTTAAPSIVEPTCLVCAARVRDGVRGQTKLVETDEGFWSVAINGVRYATACLKCAAALEGGK